MMIPYQKQIFLVATIAIVGWLVVSAIDAGTAWDSPIQTIQDTGKRFTCPSPEHAEFTFNVVVPKLFGDKADVTFVSTKWVAEGTTSGWNPAWLMFGAHYTADLEITVEGKMKTYTIDMGDIGTGLLDEQGRGTVNFVTDINYWTGECADDWSYVNGWSMTYKCKLMENGVQVASATGSVVTI